MYAFTGGNQFFVSAAEGFIFISGLVTGVINGGVTAGHGLGRVVMRILYRGWMPYCVTVPLTFAFALVLLGLRYPGAPHMEAKGIPAWVIGVLTLHRTYYLTDIIFTYALLFFAAGLAVTLIGHGYTRWVLIGSWAIWLLWQFFPREAELPWAVVDGAAFHFSAWQALFFTALIIGYHRRAIGAWFSWVRPEAVLVVSGILVLVCIGLYWTQLRPLAALLPGIGPAQLSLQFLDKADLRAGRLLAFAVVGVFAWSATTRAWAPVQRAFGWLMLPLGQRSLTAYSVHVFVVAVLGWLTVNLWRVPPQSVGANTMVHGGLAWGSYVAREVVAEIDGRFRTHADRAHRAIGGVSMGAHGALQLALNFPGTFGIVGAHTPVLRAYAEAPSYFGSPAYFAEHTPVSLVRRHPATARTLVIWIDIGLQDGWFPQAARFHEELLALRVPHEWHVYPGGHTGLYWGPHIEDYLHFYGPALERA